jgi:hypothetical protein
MPLLLVLLLLISCAKPPPPEEPLPEEPPLSALENAPPALRPWALIEAGENPLWFELGPGGPRQIPSPGDAALTPFSPWTLARNITALLAGDGRLVMAVNRDGFLLWAPGPAGRLSLFHLPGEDWDAYTQAALFAFQEEWAVLLYRDDFFIDSAAALPNPRVWGISREGGPPAAREIPAFAAFPPEAGWDLDMLRLGRDGFWYYRGVKKSGPDRDIQYRRTRDLTLPGEPSSAGVFREAVTPYTKKEAPPLLRAVLDEVSRLDDAGTAQTAAVVSPGLPAPRYYTANAAPGEPMVELAAYLEEDTGGLAEGVALVIRPDGRGVWGEASPGDEPPYRTRPFALPPLPEGFVYTRAGVHSAAVIAAWEEQENWQVGAAGFLVIRRP